jgi:hypothetical protein
MPAAYQIHHLDKAIPKHVSLAAPPQLFQANELVFASHGAITPVRIRSPKKRVVGARVARK